MKIMAVQSLFAWASLHDSPSLGTIRRCLEAIPEAPSFRDSARRGAAAATITWFPSSGASPS